MSESPRVAVLTGASRGLGRSLASALADDGYQVYGLCRGEVADARVVHVPCDLADAEHTARALADVSARVDRVDALVANSAVRGLSRVAELDPAGFEDTVRVNLSSVVALVRTFLPDLRRTGGRIVLIGSHAGSMFFEGGAAYCASKAGLKALVEVLLMEERPHGVRTSLISPGTVAIEPGDQSPTKLSSESVARTLSWVLSSPEDLAVGEVEIRPARLAEPAATGFDRLQAV